MFSSVKQTSLINATGRAIFSEEPYSLIVDRENESRMQLLRDVNSRAAQNRFSEPKERTDFDARDNMYISLVSFYVDNKYPSDDESTGERYGKVIDPLEYPELRRGKKRGNV